MGAKQQTTLGGHSVLDLESRYADRLDAGEGEPLETYGDLVARSGTRIGDTDDHDGAITIWEMPDGALFGVANVNGPWAIDLGLKAGAR